MESTVPTLPMELQILVLEALLVDENERYMPHPTLSEIQYGHSSGAAMDGNICVVTSKARTGSATKHMQLLFYLGSRASCFTAGQIPQRRAITRNIGR